MSSLKAPAKYLGFSSGTLTVASRIRKIGQLWIFESYLLAKDATTTFSDRTWCP
jgi:hypothetical protein